MKSTPSSFNSGWHERRDKRWQQWLRAIERDRNFARILFALPLYAPVRTEVLEAADRLGLHYELTSEAESATESPPTDDPRQAPPR